MSTTLLFKPIGQTYALACPQSVAGPVQIKENASCVLLSNFNNTAAAVTFTQLGASGAAPSMSFPVNGTPSGQVVTILPPLMQWPIAVTVPAGGFNMYGIAITSGNPVILCTPCEIQS